MQKELVICDPSAFTSFEFARNNSREISEEF